MDTRPGLIRTSRKCGPAISNIDLPQAPADRSAEDDDRLTALDLEHKSSANTAQEQSSYAWGQSGTTPASGLASANTPPNLPPHPCVILMQALVDTGDIYG
jgi:hypothetical protein